MRRTGLLAGETSVARYRRWHPEDVAARWFHACSSPDLDLGCSFVGWFCTFDDQFDGALGRDPQAVQAHIETLRELVHSAPGTPLRGASPVAVAFADLWAREQDGMSPAWRSRAARHWDQYLQAQVQEALHRRDAVEPDVEEYLQLRYASGFMPPLWDAVERIWRCEVPATAYNAPLLRTMRDAANQNINIVNDVYSLAKEEAHGDHHNLVLVLERQEACSRPEALRITNRMINNWMQEFLTAEAQLPLLYETLGMPAHARTNVARFTQGMRAAIRGNYDWCSRTARYHGALDSSDRAADSIAGPVINCGSAFS
ncbi:terpene synthase family protein [Streptomyces sp. NPDC001107]